MKNPSYDGLFSGIDQWSVKFQKIVPVILIITNRAYNPSSPSLSKHPVFLNRICKCGIYIVPVAPLVFPDTYFCQSYLILKVDLDILRIFQSHYMLISLHCISYASSSSCFVFIQFRWDIFNSFASYDNFDNVFLLIFCSLYMHCLYYS